MIQSTATTVRPPRVRPSSTLPRASHPTPIRHVSSVINQPIATVVAHLRSATGGNEGQTAESDPTFKVVRVSWGRQVDVRYILYEVPGGAQVTASIQGLGHSPLDPMTSMAVRAISRRIAADLSKVRDDLE